MPEIECIKWSPSSNCNCQRGVVYWIWRLNSKSFVESRPLRCVCWQLLAALLSLRAVECSDDSGGCVQCTVSQSLHRQRLPQSHHGSWWHLCVRTVGMQRRTRHDTPSCLPSWRDVCFHYFVEIPTCVDICRVKDVRYSSSSYQQRYFQLFGVPLVVMVPRECTFSDIYKAVLEKGR